MDSELSRLINALIDLTSCHQCGQEIEVRAEDLEIEEESLYSTVYRCTGEDCESVYDINIEDQDPLLYFGANERSFDFGEEDQISHYVRKERLQKESHPVHDLHESAARLDELTDILSVNRDRIIRLSERIEDEGLENSDELFREMRTDLHNYVASAYSFEDILRKNIEPNLPDHNSIDEAKKRV